MTEHLISADNLAAQVGVKPATVRDARWQARVGLRAVRLGGAVCFAARDVRRLIAQTQRGSGPKDGQR